MKTVFLFLMVVCVSCFGCDSIRAAKLKTAVENTEQAIEIICATVAQFDAAGVEIPGAEQCDKILPILSSQELDVVSKIIDCSTEVEIETPKFVECATRAGWPQLKKRLEQFNK